MLEISASETNTQSAWIERLESNRWISLLAVVIVLAVFLVTGFMGLDFGNYPDESRLIRPIKLMIQTETLLPSYYIWPTVPYLVGLGALVPEAIVYSDEANTKDLLFRFIDAPEYILRLRGLFLSITALTVLWTYLLVLKWHRSWLQALLAAALLGLSWEVAYHSRFTATDGLTMQFAALTMLLVMTAWLHPDKPAWLKLAAICAGITTGSKYTGGFLLLPVILVAYVQWRPKLSKCNLAKQIMNLILIYGIVYLATTPGTILQFKSFSYHLRSASRIYRTGIGPGPTDGSTVPEAPYTTRPGLEHLRHILVYYAFALFSRYELIAAIAFLLTVIGIIFSLKETPREALIYLTGPALYVLYMATNRLFLVRNHLVLVPYLAVMAAYGAGVIIRRLPYGWLRMVVGLGLAAMLLANGWWLIYAARTVQDRTRSGRFVAELEEYIRRHPDKRFFVSEELWQQLQLNNSGIPTNVTRDPAESDLAAFYDSEANLRSAAQAAHIGSGYTDYPNGYEQWPDLNLTVTFFGPAAINVDYYPINLQGNRIILVMTTKRIRELNLSICPLNCP